jgi:hypothetical protein
MWSISSLALDAVVAKPYNILVKLTPRFEIPISEAVRPNISAIESVVRKRRIGGHCYGRKADSAKAAINPAASTTSSTKCIMFYHCRKYLASIAHCSSHYG